MKTIRKLIRKLLGVIDPKGDFIFLISRIIGRIKIPNDSMNGDALSLYLQETSLGKKVLEFGSGGSTLIFAQTSSKIVSVESDRYFCKIITKSLRTNGLAHKASVFWVNIGPTKSFGEPWKIMNYLKRYRYQNYSSEVFKSIPEVNSSDIVFVDGRFRVACAMKAVINIKNDFTLIVDDYFDRPEYSVIDTVLGPPRTSILNTAVFCVQLENVSPELVQRTYTDYKNDYR